MSISRPQKKLLNQFERLTSDLLYMDDSIGGICIEIPEIFISLEHLNQDKPLPSDCSKILSPETLIQLSHMITNIES